MTSARIARRGRPGSALDQRKKPNASGDLAKACLDGPGAPGGGGVSVPPPRVRRVRPRRLTSKGRRAEDLSGRARRDDGVGPQRAVGPLAEERRGRAAEHQTVVASSSGATRWARRSASRSSILCESVSGPRRGIGPNGPGSALGGQACTTRRGRSRAATSAVAQSRTSRRLSSRPTHDHGGRIATLGHQPSGSLQANDRSRRDFESTQAADEAYRDTIQRPTRGAR
jgi:hypothetical protein